MEIVSIQLTEDISIKTAGGKDEFILLSSSRGGVVLTFDSIVTLAYLITPILSMIEMGNYSWIGNDTHPSVSLGNDAWMEVNGLLLYCTIQNDQGALTIHLNDLLLFYKALLKEGVFSARGMKVTGPVPCIFSHKDLQEIVSCRACSRHCWFSL